MEVHAHTHPASGGTGRKKWTHYFWEFLMLFLATGLSELPLALASEKNMSESEIWL